MTKDENQLQRPSSDATKAIAPESAVVYEQKGLVLPCSSTQNSPAVKSGNQNSPCSADVSSPERKSRRQTRRVFRRDCKIVQPEGDCADRFDRQLAARMSSIRRSESDSSIEGNDSSGSGGSCDGTWSRPYEERKKSHRKSLPKSGFYGVYANGSRWMAKIGYGGQGNSKNYYLGNYHTREEAAAAYDAAARKNHGAKANCNFASLQEAEVRVAAAVLLRNTQERRRAAEEPKRALQHYPPAKRQKRNVVGGLELTRKQLKVVQEQLAALDAEEMVLLRRHEELIQQERGRKIHRTNSDGPSPQAQAHIPPQGTILHTV